MAKEQEVTQSLTIFQRLCGINRDLEAIGKNSRNAQQGYAFRGIDAIADNLHPLLAKWGVVCAPRCLDFDLQERVTAKGAPQIHARLKMAWLLTGEAGDSLEIVMPSEALDSSDKATNKALSAGFKYGLTQLFLIPFSDVAEADKETPDLGTKKEPAPPKEKSEDTAKKEADEITFASEAGVFLSTINTCQSSGDLIKVAKGISDSKLPEKYKTALRKAFSAKKTDLDVA